MYELFILNAITLYVADKSPVIKIAPLFKVCGPWPLLTLFVSPQSNGVTPKRCLTKKVQTSYKNWPVERNS